MTLAPTYARYPVEFVSGLRVSELAGGGRKSAGGKIWSGALILAPPSAHGSTWTRKFAPYSTGVASGWMRIRGTRRRRAVDRGFALSDHADWDELQEAIR